jgi:hypothetical protein
MVAMSAGAVTLSLEVLLWLTSRHRASGLKHLTLLVSTTMARNVVTLMRV